MQRFKGLGFPKSISACIMLDSSRAFMHYKYNQIFAAEKIHDKKCIYGNLNSIIKVDRTLSIAYEMVLGPF